MENFKETVKEFNILVQDQKWEEALNRFYDEDILFVDNEGGPQKGLQSLKNGLADFTANTSNVSVTLKNVIVSDDMSVTQWGKFDYDQLSLQRWKEGKIIHERHHYKTEKL
jgi:ketosteroid isomerase-like protein